MKVPDGRILVIGLGRSGTAVAEFLVGMRDAGSALEVFVADEGDSCALQETAARFVAADVDVSLDVREAPGPWDLVVTSPGVPPASPLLQSAAAAGAPVVSEIELAYEYSQAPFVAVTGTNGKTTVTRMAARALDASGFRAEAVGNIGTPAIGVTPSLASDDVAVAEVSSFQLARIMDFRPHVSVLLNVTDDHLDWHGSREGYLADKARIFENQCGSDLAVIVVDDPGAASFADRAAALGIRVCRVSFDRRPGSGAFVADGVLTLSTREGDVGLLSVSDLQVIGRHNVTNALAAAAAAFEMGADPAMIALGLATFVPIEHRLEPAGHVDGVDYYNDSKATNPDAVLKALTAFEDRPVVLLLGGRNKGNRFDVLAEPLSEAVRGVVAFGEATPEIEADLGDAVTVVSAAGLVEAVAAGRELARPGDAVLLSPACASFDEFPDYEERGRAFKALVAKMAEDSEVATGG